MGLTDHLICLLRGKGGEEWESGEVSVTQVNVLIRAVTCLASLVEMLPRALKKKKKNPSVDFTSDIYWGGISVFYVRHAVNVDQWKPLNPHSAFSLHPPL